MVQTHTRTLTIQLRPSRLSSAIIEGGKLLAGLTSAARGCSPLYFTYVILSSITPGSPTEMVLEPIF